jgi:hypothetical protein
MPKSDARTYDEWRLQGRRVRRGEKSHMRNEKGQPVFTEDQLADEPGWYVSEVLGIEQSELC